MPDCNVTAVALCASSQNPQQRAASWSVSSPSSSSPSAANSTSGGQRRTLVVGGFSEDTRRCDIEVCQRLKLHLLISSVGQLVVRGSSHPRTCGCTLQVELVNPRSSLENINYGLELRRAKLSVMQQSERIMLFALLSHSFTSLLIN